MLVGSLVLCQVPSLDETLGEIMRVLAPGGELRFHEHVHSTRPLAALAERLISPIWSPTANGCHPARDTVRSVSGAGSAVERLDRFEIDRITYVCGVARRP